MNTVSDANISFSLEKPENQDRGKPHSLNSEDKYNLLCLKYASLKRAFDRIAEGYRHYKELSIYLQSERDYYQEIAQEAQGK